MKLILSKILFYIGDTISNLLYFEWLGIFLYPVYKKIMIWSSLLDEKGVIWREVNDQ